MTQRIKTSTEELNAHLGLLVMAGLSEAGCNPTAGCPAVQVEPRKTANTPANAQDFFIRVSDLTPAEESVR